MTDLAESTSALADLAGEATASRGALDDGWVRVCAESELQPDRGAAAIVGGEQVALFRTGTGSLHAVANRDPFSGANVVSRGLVGDIDGVAVVASPVYKQRFCLASGRCLDDPAVSLRTWEVRSRDGVVEVRGGG